jgi:membrane associated rhomboid family serine protease
LAFAKVESIRAKYEFEEIYNSTPDYWWEYVLGFLGLPVEYNSREINRLPLFTWTLATIIVLVAMVTFPDLEAAVRDWALIPDDFTRHYGLTFISSFLLHGGIVHLLGNLYFLLIFGDNVEDVLGLNTYILLIALSAFVGDIAHIVIDPRSSMPVIGASGGISGLIAYYCLSFPKAKIGFLWWFRWFRIPVGWMFFIWVAGQVVGIIQQVSGFGDVSSLAHLGGAIVGFLYWLATSDLQRGNSGNTMLNH